MKKIPRAALIDFELVALDFVEAYEVETKNDLELLSSILHEHLETAMLDYAVDADIEDYESQY